MFCTHCGKELPDKALFCTNCGNMIKAEAQVKQAEPVQSTPPVQAAPYLQSSPYRQAAPYGQAAPSSAPPVQTPSYVKAAAVEQPARAGDSRKAGIWPAACGVMGILALIFHLTGASIMMIAGLGGSLFSAVLIITYILMIVVFFVHTMKIPWVTIAPFLIYIIFLFYQRRYFIEDLGYYRGISWQYFIQIMTLFLPIILFIFYVLLVLIRPEGSALRIVFLIFTILEFITLFVAMCINIYQMIRFNDTYYLFYSIFAQLSTLFFFIGYGVAGMSVRKLR